MNGNPEHDPTLAKVRWWNSAWFWAIVGFAIVGGLTAGQFWFSHKAKCLLKQSDFSTAGNFGDSFGVVNAIISGLAFVALVITLVLQSRELQLQRQELAETRNELRGSRRAQEMQVQNSLQSARIASLAAILNHKYNQFTCQPSIRGFIQIEMNRWNAELEAEITSLHYAGRPLHAANAMLHSAATEIGQAPPSVSLSFQLPADLPMDLKNAMQSLDALLDQLYGINSTVNGQATNDSNDPLKPIVRAWLLKAKEVLELAKRQEGGDLL